MIPVNRNDSQLRSSPGVPSAPWPWLNDADGEHSFVYASMTLFYNPS